MNSSYFYCNQALKVKRLFLVLLLSCVLYGCRSPLNKVAAIQETSLSAQEEWLQEEIITYKDGEISTVSAIDNFDQLEKFNRTIFAFNKALDAIIAKPVALVYGRLMPDLCRDWVRNFLRHIATPLYIVYGAISLDGKFICKSMSRFIVNSFFGTLGINDPASRFETLKFEKKNGAMIMKKYNLPFGSYLVLPVFGASSTRDLLGGFLDFSIDPLNYFLGVKQELIIKGVQIVETRYNYLELADSIEQTSIDEYAAVRNIYMQMNE